MSYYFDMDEFFNEEFYNGYWSRILSAKQAQQDLSWDDISRKASITKSAIDTARRKNKCLGFEETVAIVSALDLYLDDLIDSSLRCFIRPDSKKELMAIASKMKPYATETFPGSYWRLLNGIRQSKGMKWRDIEEASEIGGSTISTAKSYNRTLPFDKSAKLITSLGYSIDDFVSTLHSINTNLTPITVPDKSQQSLLERFSRLSAKNQQIVSSLIDSLLKGDDLENSIQEGTY